MSNLNMPRLGIKRALEKFLLSQNLKYVQDAFTTGVKKEVQVMIPAMQEEYTRIGLNSKLACVLNITFDVFSEINETGVHEAVYKIVTLGPDSAFLREFKINKIYPNSSFTSYSNESSDGNVSAQVVLTLEYYM
ncbi:hypothetical protein GUY47_08260 [Enterobacter hormaechei]|uniref:hypothetical protein n=1 Tax=Enterobacter hormaechei TaxID=158836 RepID=UPI0018844D14|nr:hypothetical protein [Enterobacter hormaechei]MCW4931020.1 hypothetical protein [Enterobacter hormaechei subsp. xiangfangensis]QOX69986.1 hypothetical protein GUY47_08260 [Enterobacter hormaechei]